MWQDLLPHGSRCINNAYLSLKVYKYDLLWAIWSTRATVLLEAACFATVEDFSLEVTWMADCTSPNNFFGSSMYALMHLFMQLVCMYIKIYGCLSRFWSAFCVLSIIRHLGHLKGDHNFDKHPHKTVYRYWLTIRSYKQDGYCSRW